MKILKGLRFGMWLKIIFEGRKLSPLNLIAMWKLLVFDGIVKGKMNYGR
jgi:hypothetical protein